MHSKESLSHHKALEHLQNIFPALHIPVDNRNSGLHELL